MSTSSLLYTEINPDTLIAEMFLRHFPAGSALLVVAVVASGMSTLDSGLLTLSGTLARDLARTPSTHIRNARLSSIGLLGIVVVFGLSETGRGAITPLVTLGASIGTLFLWPVLGMTFFSGVTSRSVLSGYLAGFAGVLIGHCSAVLPFGAGTAGFLLGGSGFLISHGIIAKCNFVTEPAGEARSPVLPLSGK